MSVLGFAPIGYFTLGQISDTQGISPDAGGGGSHGKSHNPRLRTGLLPLQPRPAAPKPRLSPIPLPPARYLRTAQPSVTPLPNLAPSLSTVTLFERTQKQIMEAERRRQEDKEDIEALLNFLQLAESKDGIH